MPLHVEGLRKEDLTPLLYAAPKKVTGATYRRLRQLQKEKNIPLLERNNDPANPPSEDDRKACASLGANIVGVASIETEHRKGLPLLLRADVKTKLGTMYKDLFMEPYEMLFHKDRVEAIGARINAGNGCGDVLEGIAYLAPRTRGDPLLRIGIVAQGINNPVLLLGSHDGVTEYTCLVVAAVALSKGWFPCHPQLPPDPAIGAPSSPPRWGQCIDGGRSSQRPVVGPGLAVKLRLLVDDPARASYAIKGPIGTCLAANQAALRIRYWARAARAVATEPGSELANLQLAVEEAAAAAERTLGGLVAADAEELATGGNSGPWPAARYLYFMAEREQQLRAAVAALRAAAA